MAGEAPTVVPEVSFHGTGQLAPPRKASRLPPGSPRSSRGSGVHGPNRPYEAHPHPGDGEELQCAHRADAAGPCARGRQELHGSDCPHEAHPRAGCGQGLYGSDHPDEGGATPLLLRGEPGPGRCAHGGTARRANSPLSATHGFSPGGSALARGETGPTSRSSPACRTSRCSRDRSRSQPEAPRRREPGDHRQPLHGSAATARDEARPPGCRATSRCRSHDRGLPPQPACSPEPADCHSRSSCPPEGQDP